jgi:hypothetical protein
MAGKIMRPGERRQVLQKKFILSINSASRLLKDMPMRKNIPASTFVHGLAESWFALSIQGEYRAVGFYPARVCRFFEGAGWS